MGLFENITQEGIRSDILSEMAASGMAVNEGSFCWHVASSVAWRIYNTYIDIRRLIPIAYIDETSGEYIDRRASEVGIVRKPGLKAVGAVTVNGTDGTVIPAGTAFATAGGLVFYTDADAVIAEGEIEIGVTAAEIGNAYNIAAGKITAMPVAIYGVSGFVNAAAFTGGEDREADAALFARWQEYWLKPATSGNANEYRQWALSVDGVGYAKVLPLARGAGTVDIIIADENIDPPPSATVAACQAYIDSVRPIGADADVVAASAKTVNVAATVNVEATVTAEDVETALAASIAAYFADEAFKEQVVRYNQISYLLLDIPGVRDFTQLSVNGGTANISLDDDEIPKCGTVVVGIA